MIYQRTAKDTLTAIEMAHGDELLFTLRCGRAVRFEVLSSEAEVLETSLKNTRVEENPGGTIVSFRCRLKVDGHEIALVRYISTQESFYVPYVINGARVWLDCVGDVFRLIADAHGGCAPGNDVRFALQDASLPIAPEPILPWCPLPPETLRIEESYAGEDCWLGTYFGASAHGGVDINHAPGTPLYAPIGIDFGYLFHSLDHSDNNNRWRGIRKWANGDVWILQVHHLIGMRAPLELPLRAGTLYADAAGVHIGAHAHSHFVFGVLNEQGKILIDAWILFWAMYERERDLNGDIRAVIAPLAPSGTGEWVSFSTEGSRAGKKGTALRCRWCFGDGTTSDKANPCHRFHAPGVYAVTLTVSDGVDFDSMTQHITVSGARVPSPQLTIRADSLPAFDPRGAYVSDVYRRTPALIPHQLSFRLQEAGDETVRHHLWAEGLRFAWQLNCRLDPQLLPVTCSLEDMPEGIRLTVSVKAGTLPRGQYTGMLRITSAEDPTVCESIAIHIQCGVNRPETGCTIGVGDPGVYSTPFFWVGHRFVNWPWPKGVNGRYLINGRRAWANEYVQFTPYIAPGEYEISLTPDGPCDPEAAYQVSVLCEDGWKTQTVQPGKSRVVGRFTLGGYGMDAVRILAEGSKGQVYVDGVTWRKIGP